MTEQAYSRQEFSSPSSIPTSKYMEIVQNIREEFDRGFGSERACILLRDITFGVGEGDDRLIEALNLVIYINKCDPNAKFNREFWYICESISIYASKVLCERICEFLGDIIPTTPLIEKSRSFEVMLKTGCVRKTIIDGLLKTDHYQHLVSKLVGAINRFEELEYGAKFDLLASRVSKNVIERVLFLESWKYHKRPSWTLSRYLSTVEPKYLLKEWKEAGQPLDYKGMQKFLEDRLGH